MEYYAFNFFVQFDESSSKSTVLWEFWGLGWLTAFPGAVRFTEVFYGPLDSFGTPLDGLLWAQEIKHHFKYFMHFKLTFLIRSTGSNLDLCIH